MNPRLALDTNAFRALAEDNKLLAGYAMAAGSIGLPVIVLGELYHGVLSGNQQERNLQFVNRFLASPRVEILHIDQQTAKFFGEIAAYLRSIGRPIQQNDIWIAALCKQYDYALATADKGFGAVMGLETVGF